MTRIRRRLAKFGLPHLQIVVPSERKAMVIACERVVDKLIEDAQVDVLAALQRGQITLAELVEADRAGTLTGAAVMGKLSLRRNLWTEWAAIHPTGRYAVARAKLQRESELGEKATVGDLATLKWNLLMVRWRSPADWNHLRRAISRFLSLYMGSKHHAFRHQVIERIPLQREEERSVDISLETFAGILARARADVRPVFVTLVLTGMRVRVQFLRCGTDHLTAPQQLEDGTLSPGRVRVPRAKGERRDKHVLVAPQFWPIVTAAIPSPLQYKRLYQLWTDACVGAGASGLRLHDLRHLHGKYAEQFGALVSEIRESMGHSNIAMTHRYTKTSATASVATALQKALTGLTSEPGLLQGVSKLCQ